jgi:hypothetical protein
MLLHSHNPFGLHLRIYGLPLRAQIAPLDTLIRALCLVRLGENADLQLAIGTCSFEHERPQDRLYTLLSYSTTSQYWFQVGTRTLRLSQRDNRSCLFCLFIWVNHLIPALLSCTSNGFSWLVWVESLTNHELLVVQFLVWFHPCTKNSSCLFF